MQKGCEKCEYTGFAYGTIPCMCVVDAPSKEVFVDHSKYRPHINGVPLQPNGDDISIDIDNQYKPDPDGDGGYGCLSLTFPVQDRDFQIMKVSPENGKIIDIGEPVFYGKDKIFVGRVLCSAKRGEWLKVQLPEGCVYRVNSSDPNLTFGEQPIKRCPTCGHEE